MPRLYHRQGLWGYLHIQRCYLQDIWGLRVQRVILFLSLVLFSVQPVFGEEVVKEIGKAGSVTVSVRTDTKTPNSKLIEVYVYGGSYNSKLIWMDSAEARSFIGYINLAINRHRSAPASNSRVERKLEPMRFVTSSIQFSIVSQAGRKDINLLAFDRYESTTVSVSPSELRQLIALIQRALR